MIGWRRRWQRYRRQNRVLVALYLLLLGLAGGGYLLFSRMRALPPEELTNRLLTFLLWWFDLTLIAILLFILLRNLVKLFLERHHGILGSRFRTKLLLSYLVLIVVPTGALFILGASLLSQATASWFAAPVEGMARTGTELAEGVRLDSESRVRRIAGVVAAALARAVRRAGSPRRTGAPARPDGERLHRVLPELRRRGRAGRPAPAHAAPPPAHRGAGRSSSAAVAASAPAAPSSSAPGSGWATARGWSSATPSRRIWSRPRDDWPRAARRTSGSSSSARRSPRRWCWASAGWRWSWCSRRSGSGLYLSRSFTEPLLALVATTNRVAAGETLEEVPLPAEDEVGLLVGSFNAMVRRLRGQEQEMRSTLRSPRRRARRHPHRRPHPRWRARHGDREPRRGGAARTPGSRHRHGAARGADRRRPRQAGRGDPDGCGTDPRLAHDPPGRRFPHARGRRGPARQRGPARGVGGGARGPHATACARSDRRRGARRPAASRTRSRTRSPRSAWPRNGWPATSSAAPRTSRRSYRRGAAPSSSTSSRCRRWSTPSRATRSCPRPRAGRSGSES